MLYAVFRVWPNINPITCRHEISNNVVLVREPVIGLIKWLRPKGLKVCSYGEKCADFKNQTLKKSAGTQVLCATEYPGVCNISNSAKMGVPLQVYTLNHIISEVKCKCW